MERYRGHRWLHISLSFSPEWERKGAKTENRWWVGRGKNVSASPRQSKVGNSTGKNGRGNIYKVCNRHRSQQVYMTKPPLVDPRETVPVAFGFGR